MTEPRMLYLPAVFQQGKDAALLGTNMSDIEHPLGFTFCPHRDGSVERHNFLGGCVEAYMKEDGVIRGEQ